jgi:tetratricopeptide (TPR) repeat protein
MLALLGSTVPAVAQTGRVMGTVVDSSGRAIKGAVITAVNQDAILSGITSTTDDKGRFGMLGLRAGVWTFTAEAPGFEPTVGTAPIRAASLGAPLRFVMQRVPEVIPGALTRDIAEQVNEADALRAQGRYAQALAAYQAIHARNPKVSSLNIVMADTLRLQAEGEQDSAVRQTLYARAITFYQDALKDEATSTRARLDLGLTQVSAGLVDDGVRTLQALVSSAPDSSAARDAAARLAELSR